MVFLILKVSPWDKREEAFKKKLEFARENSDYLALLQAYKVSNAALRCGSFPKLLLSSTFSAIRNMKGE